MHRVIYCLKRQGRYRLLWMTVANFVVDWQFGIQPFDFQVLQTTSRTLAWPTHSHQSQFASLELCSRHTDFHRQLSQSRVTHSKCTAYCSVAYFCVATSSKLWAKLWGSLLFHAGQQQLSCPVLRPPSGPNARPQDNIPLHKGNNENSLELNTN